MSPLFSLLLALQADPAALAQTAAADMRAARYAEAAVKYEQLIKLVPGNPGLQMNLGLARFSAGNYAGAVAPLESAVRLDPKMAPAWFLLGMTHWKREDPRSAIPALERAVALDGRNQTARLELADAYLATRQTARALPIFEQLATERPEDPKVWLGVGHSHASLAEQTFAAIPPESPASLALRAKARYETGQYRGAFALWKQVLARDPGFCGAHEGIAAVYRALNQPDWASAEARKGTACSPSGNYAKALDHSRRAAEAFEKLAALPPSAEFHELRAEAHSLKGEHQQAAAALDAALALRPGDPRLTLAKARALWRSDSCPAAVAIAAKLPPSAERELIRGDCLLSDQKPEEAIPSLERAVKSDPGLLPAQASLGRALQRAGRDAEAAMHLRAALPIDEDGSLHLALSRSLQRAGQPEEAKRMIAEYQRRSAASQPAAELTPP